MNSIFDYFTGIRRVCIVCGDEGRFLTECVRRRIHISNIQRIDTVTYEFNVSAKDYDEIAIIASRLRCEITVIEEKSIIKWLSRYRRRKFFAAGFFLFTAIILVRSSFISEINVTGNELISPEEIVAELGKAGFSEGDFRYGIDVREVQSRVMLDYDKLSWIWINIHGTVAEVSVRERIAKPEMEDRSDYCNTVASRDALITALMPRTGKPVVKIGDVVQKGDVIISGIAETKNGEIRYMHADGIVTGRTWYEEDGVYCHTRCDRYLTGNSKKHFSLTLGNHTFPVFAENASPYTAYDHSKNEQKLKIFKKTLPISFTIDTYCEIIETYTEISDTEVVDTAVTALGEKLLKELSEKEGLTVIKKTHMYEKLPDGNIYVRVCVECSENIGEYSPITGPEYTENSDQEEQ